MTDRPSPSADRKPEPAGVKDEARDKEYGRFKNPSWWRLLYRLWWARRRGFPVRVTAEIQGHRCYLWERKP